MTATTAMTEMTTAKHNKAQRFSFKKKDWPDEGNKLKVKLLKANRAEQLLTSTSES